MTYYWDAQCQHHLNLKAFCPTLGSCSLEYMSNALAVARRFVVGISHPSLYDCQFEFGSDLNVQLT